MTRYYTLSPDRLPIPCFNVLAWAIWFDDAERTVAVDHYGDGQYAVSTVFLALDHNFSKSGDPLLFETALFGPDGVDVVERYRTWGEAAAGHELVRSIATHEYTQASRLSGALLKRLLAGRQATVPPEKA
jgi:hypothetical protein